MTRHLLPIRHHSGLFGRATAAALEEIDPDIVAVELPADCTAALNALLEGEATAPLAMVATSDGVVGTWPLAPWSPEWVAAVWAAEHGRQLVAFDAPASVILADPAAGVGSELDAVARRAGFSDSDTMLEVALGGGFGSVTELMAGLRGSDEPSEREQWMLAALAKLPVRKTTVVVCGAWHAPVLDRAPTGGRPHATKAHIAWVPWTNRGLGSSRGYHAGVRGPRWEQHVYEHSDPAGTWMVELSRAAREHGSASSAARAIDAAVLARSLRSVRDESTWRLATVIDAAVATIGHGHPSSISTALDEMLYGGAEGTLPDGTPTVPLAAAVLKELKALRLPSDGIAKELALDLRQERDRAKSVLLERLTLAGIDYGQLAHNAGTGTFKQRWIVRWTDDTTLQCVDRSRYGALLADVASAVVWEQASVAGSIADVASLALRALRADLEPAARRIIRLVDQLAGDSTDTTELLKALRPLSALLIWGDAFGTDTAAVESLVDACVVRVCARVGEEARDQSGPTAADLAGAIHLFNPMVQASHGELWTRALLAIERCPRVQGVATRIVWERGAIDADAMAMRAAAAMLFGGLDEASEFIEGMLMGDPALLAGNDGLLAVVDDWLVGLPADHAEQAIVTLRRAFRPASPAARRDIAAAVQQRRNPSELAGELAWSSRAVFVVDALEALWGERVG